MRNTSNADVMARCVVVARLSTSAWGERRRDVIQIFIGAFQRVRPHFRLEFNRHVRRNQEYTKHARIAHCHASPIEQ